MLKPAIMYKQEIEKEFMNHVYSNDFFLYSGYAGSNELPNIELKDNYYQWAIIDERTEKVIGYFAYYIDRENDTVSRFGLFSFDRGNIRIGRDVYEKMIELIEFHRRVEWRMIGGNPVQNSYDRLCKKYNGNRVHLHAVTKDENGKWHDEYIYEIIKDSNSWHNEYIYEYIK